jgi:hypothetical protein
VAERWSDILQLRPRGVESRWCLQGPGSALAALACDLGLHAAAGPLPAQAQLRAPAGQWLPLGPQEAWWMPGGDPPGAAAARVEAVLRSGTGLLRLGDPAGTDRGATDNGPVIACADLGDAFIGWDRPTRERNLQHLTNNTRFLIPGWVQVPHLASHVLGLIVRRIRADWQAKYGHPIHALETFVDRSRFKGTCYRAANWRRVGQTRGRTRNDRAHRIQAAVKDVYVYPLAANFREALRDDRL